MPSFTISEFSAEINYTLSYLKAATFIYDKLYTQLHPGEKHAT